MRVRCPICGRTQRVTDGEIGLPTLCPACGNRFTAQGSSPAVPTGTVETTLDENLPPAVADAPAPHGNGIATLLWFVAVIVAFAGGIGLGWALHAVVGASATDAVTPTPVVAPVAEKRVPSEAPTASEPPPKPSDTTLLPHPITEPAPRPATQAVLAPATTKTVDAAPAPRPVVVTPRFVPVRPAGADAPDLDQLIGESIEKGTSFLLSEFKDGKLVGQTQNGKVMYSGFDSLACYALLQAGEATRDPRLAVHAPLVEALLDGLRDLPLDTQREAFPPSVQNPFTYAHSLRAAALSVYNRPQDKHTLRADTAWLLRAARKGAYTYGLPPHVSGPLADDIWDNSNSQYGALGVWSALQSNVEVPTSYWAQVEKHWLDCQLPNGQWGYSPGGGNAELSMTVAGITTLFVTQDQLSLQEQATKLGRPPFIPALARGLDWLETGDNAVSLPFTNRTYNLYGLERAALASGFKYFGKHDWYRELATGALRGQQSDGSWQEEDPIIDTAFTLLFLSRGRHPILMDKLRFEGSWANRPRDISNLAVYASKQLERPFNWQVVSLNSSWTDWTDSPVLYIASHEPFPVSDTDADKLRDYALNGGLIYLQTDGDSSNFDRFAGELSKRLFPQYTLRLLPPTDPLFSTLYPLKKPPEVEAVSNGSRLLLVHCKTDVNRVWQLRNWSTSPESFQFGVNLFIYAAGKSDFLNKLKTAYVPEPAINPVATFTVAKIRYGPGDDPEPDALRRWARNFFAHTSIRPDIVAVDAARLSPDIAPIAVLTGTTANEWTSDQIAAVRSYVNGGGILLIDAAGGSVPFAQSARGGLLEKAFGESPLQNLKSDDPTLQATFPGMTPVSLRLRRYLAEKLGQPSEPLQQLIAGRGRLVFSDYDLTTALLGTATYAIDGYTPESATSLLDNLALFAVERPKTGD